jgi:hypothetical protein
VSTVVPDADTTLVPFDVKLLANAFWLLSRSIRLLALLIDEYARAVEGVPDDPDVLASTLVAAIDARDKVPE